MVTLEEPHRPRESRIPLELSTYFDVRTPTALLREPDGTPYDAPMGTPQGVEFRVGRNPSPDGRWTEAPWAAAAGVLPAAAALVSRMRAIDLAYHVRAGELALRSGDVVRTDPFTFTVGGEPWLNQQWGAQVMFASAHRAWGWNAVALTYAAAIGAGFSFLYRSCRRAGVDPRSAAILTILGFVVGAGSLGARPQALAVPLFTATWLLLARRDRWTWLVPVLAVVWANVHGSFVLAPALAAFALGDDLLARRPAGRGVGVFVATIVATFLTPFGPSVWSYALDVATDDTIRRTVVEWQPPSPLSGAGALFWLSGVAVASLALSRRSAVRAIDVVRLLFFFALGAAALRSTVWWGLAAPPILAAWLAGPQPSAAQPSAEDGSAPADAHRVQALTAAASVVVLVAAFLVRSGTDPETGASRRLGADAPEVLVDATRRAVPAGSRLLVFQPFASWFEYSLPGDPVMVDSRIELFPDEVWRDYDTAIVADDRWRDVVEGWRVGAIVLPPGAVLADELHGDPDWRALVETDAGSVFARRS